MKSYQTGILHHRPEAACPGLTLIAPMRHESVHLIDMQGRLVHAWALPGALGSKACLLPGGHLLCSVVTSEGIAIPGAKGGRMLELDWDGRIVWECVDHDQHHDLLRLADGNTLYLAREEMHAEEAARIAGGLPGTSLHGRMYGDVVREVNRLGERVWEWAFKDVAPDTFALAPDCHRGEWAHANSLAVTCDGNVLVSFRHLDTIVIVDRVSKAVVWSRRDVTWGHQHNAEMLPNGNITLFANGMNNLHQPLHSRAIEFNPATGETVWQFIDPQRWTFFSPVMGGAQRLPNGNTLITESLNGRIFEVTHAGAIVWDYIVPMQHPNPVLHAPSNAVFRAYRYEVYGPELAGRL